MHSKRLQRLNRPESALIMSLSSEEAIDKNLQRLLNCLPCKKLV